MGSAVLRRRHAEPPAEARRERADAAQSDGEADVRDRSIGGAQERRRALEPAHEEVLVRRLAELAAELAAEVRRRELRGAREGLHVERLAVPRVDEILRAEKMACGVRGEHASEYGRGS